MAKRVAIPFKRMAVRIVGPREEYLAARVQNFDMPANLPTTDIDELGNPQHAGTVVDRPEVTATIQAFDTSVKLFSVLTGTSLTSYPGAGVSINSLTDVDIIGVIRDESVADYVKTIHGRKARVTGFSYSYSVDGEATEEYTFTGTNKRYFRYDVVVDAYTDSDSSPLTLSETPLILKNGDYILSYIHDGTYYTEVSSSPTAGDGEYQYSAGTLILADAIVTYAVAVYHANTGGNEWSDVSDNTIPAAVRGKDINISISANDIKRVQSINIRGDLPTETVEEMGNDEIVGYITQVPKVTGDLEVLDTDLQLISLFTTGSTTVSANEYGVSEYTYDNLSLDIVISNPSGVVLKTLYIPAIEITGDSHTVNVGGMARERFNFRSNTGALTIYSGSR